MITKFERDRDKAVLAAATPLPWRWWTSNSMRRLSSDPTGKAGDVAHAFRAADGVPDIAIREADMAAIETGVNAIGRYIADAEEAERRIAEIEQWHNASTDPEHGDERTEEVLALVLKILRGGQ